jgi:hypothetical protein
MKERTTEKRKEAPTRRRRCSTTSAEERKYEGENDRRTISRGHEGEGSRRRKINSEERAERAAGREQKARKRNERTNREFWGV